MERMVDSPVSVRKLRAAALSVFVNLGLAGVKLAVAYLTGSIAIIAEVAHSLFDLLASLLAYTGIRKANEPADLTHHFGHEKFESLSAFAQTLLIGLTGLFVLYEAGRRLLYPERTQYPTLALVMMIGVLVVDYVIARYLHRVSHDYSSRALEADAFHFTTDLWSGLAVVVGLVFVQLGYPAFDSFAASMVGLIMLKGSVDMGWKSLGPLSDQSPSRSILRRMSQVIRRTPGVMGIHKLKVRQAGGVKLHAELHVFVSPRMSVTAGHRIAHAVEARLQKAIPHLKDATVHIEPASLPAAGPPANAGGLLKKPHSRPPQGGSQPR